MGDFGKLNFSVSFNRTSAFPIEANGYFETLEEAQAAAATAVEVGSAESTYYIGQTLTVVTEGNAKNYIIQPDKTLLEVGSGSDSAEIAITNGEEPQGDEVLWVDMNENTSSSWEELGIQPKLESGVNIKTINSESILGEGNIELSSGGLDDAPSDGVTYGRKDGSWVKVNYGTPDEVLNIDELLSLISSETSIEVPTPEGVFEKVENARNKGICYLDMRTLMTGLVIPMGIAKAEAENEQAAYAIDASYEANYNESYLIKMKILAQVGKDKSTVTVSQLIIPRVGMIAGLDDLSQMASLNGYSKPSSYSAISSIDTINEAIGKLEAGLGTGGTSTEVLDLSDIGLSSDINVTETITISQDVLDRVMKAYQKNINTVKIDNQIASCNIGYDGSVTLINIAPCYLLYGEALLIIFKTLTFNGTQLNHFNYSTCINVHIDNHTYSILTERDFDPTYKTIIISSYFSQGLSNTTGGEVRGWLTLKQVLDKVDLNHNMESSGEVILITSNKEYIRNVSVYTKSDGKYYIRATYCPEDTTKALASLAITITPSDDGTATYDLVHQYTNGFNFE